MYTCLRRVCDCLLWCFCDGYHGVKDEEEDEFKPRLRVSSYVKIPTDISYHQIEVTPTRSRGSTPRERVGHRKQLRPKDVSFSESVIQDFNRKEIPSELASLYDLQEQIGAGSTSKVYKCKRRMRKEFFACKVIDKRRLQIDVDDREVVLEQLRKEIEVLQQLHHQNIVGFEDVVETGDKIFIVMELVQGGELYEYLLDRGALSEDVALHVMRQVMSAIAYMHERGVVHRDLKAENVLIVNPHAMYPTVKLIDFGFSTILRHNLTGSFLGTGGYLAPEMRQQKLYSESVDIWAAGVLLYLIISHRLPFNADVEILPPNRQQVARKFELSFPEAVWKERSEALKDLVRHMLHTDPMRRYTARQVVRHPWMLYGSKADRLRQQVQQPRGGAAGDAGSAHQPLLQPVMNGHGQPTKENGHGPGPHQLRSGPSYGAVAMVTAGAPAIASPSRSDHYIRHVKSSLHLERPLMPTRGLSRTPPASRGGGPSMLHEGLEERSSVKGARATGDKGGISKKPVLVSYCPQTLHNPLAGDLLSASTLSLKHTDKRHGLWTAR